MPRDLEKAGVALEARLAAAKEANADGAPIFTPGTACRIDHTVSPFRLAGSDPKFIENCN